MQGIWKSNMARIIDPGAFPGSHEPEKPQTFLRWRASASANGATEFILGPARGAGALPHRQTGPTEITLGPAEPDPGGGKRASETGFPRRRGRPSAPLSAPAPRLRPGGARAGA